MFGYVKLRIFDRKMIKKKYFEGKNREKVKAYLKKIEEETKETHFLNVLGKSFAVFPTVFSPKYFKDPEFFARELPIKKGKTFLEIGSGSGIISIFALNKGASAVTAIDINPKAVDNTEYNAKLHNVQEKIKVLHGDVFDPLKDEKFDTVFWNVPFGLVKEKDLNYLEKGVWDTEYNSIIKFIEQAKNYLNESGRVLIGFSSTIGDLDYLYKILEDNGYTFTILKTLDSQSVDFSTKFEIIEARLKC